MPWNAAHITSVMSCMGGSHGAVIETNCYSDSNVLQRETHEQGEAQQKNWHVNNILNSTGFEESIFRAAESKSDAFD